jgi:hypothetical protein
MGSGVGLCHGGRLLRQCPASYTTKGLVDSRTSTGPMDRVRIPRRRNGIRTQGSPVSEPWVDDGLFGWWILVPDGGEEGEHPIALE